MSALPPKSTGTPKDLPAELDAGPQLEQAVNDLVELVPPEKRDQAITSLVRFVATVEEYQGNLPHPKHAAEYEQICPGTLNRLLQMREKELDYSIERDREMRGHAHRWELQDQKNAFWHANLGMGLGFALGLALIAGAVTCAFIGQPALGGGLVAASAISMVPAFINGRREKGDRRDGQAAQEQAAPPNKPASPRPPKKTRRR